MIITFFLFIVPRRLIGIKSDTKPFMNLIDNVVFLSIDMNLISQMMIIENYN